MLCFAYTVLHIKPMPICSLHRLTVNFPKPSNTLLLKVTLSESLKSYLTNHTQVPKLRLLNQKLCCAL